jgi:hypothetical protein
MLHSAMSSDNELMHSAPVVTVVLVDPRLKGGLMGNSGFRGRRGDSCACPGTALRVVLTGIHVRSSSVR